MHINISHLLHHYGSFSVFFILFFEMVGIPFPAETTLTLSGFEWANGTLKLLPLIVAASLGNIVGSSVAFGIGRFLGRPVILRFGKYVGITHERLHNANEKIHKYQGWVIIFGKFIAGIRVLIPYLSGLNRMNFFVFSILNTISSVIWVCLFILLGKYIGVEWTKYHQQLHHYLVPGIIVIIILVVALLTLKIYRNKKRKNKDKEDTKL